jgi:hypothetical protein
MCNTQCKGAQETFGGDEYFIMFIVIMESQQDSSVQTHQIVNIKCA